jgi:hypothetical protein
MGALKSNFYVVGAAKSLDYHSIAVFLDNVDIAIKN